MDTVRVNDEAQEFDRVNVEFALLDLCKEIVLDKSVQNLVNLLNMYLGIFGVNKNIVEVNDNTNV